MKIEHVAIMTPHHETLPAFYCAQFGCLAGPLYENPAKGFASRFLRFPEGARLELMQKVGLPEKSPAISCGLAHLALSVGGEDAVRSLTAQLARQGVRICSEPRWTGDGYFESVVADPDGNQIEITA